MIKLIDTPPLKLKRSVNYSENFGTKCHLLKIENNEFNFIKLKECQCNLFNYFIA